MARVRLTKIETGGKNPTALVEFTFAAANATTFNDFIPTGHELILIRATANTTLTIGGTKDAKGRAADKVLTLLAGKDYVLGPLLDFHGWRFGDGTIHLNASAVTVTLAILKLR